MIQTFAYQCVLGLTITLTRAWPSQSFKTESFTPPIFNVTKPGALLAPGLLFLAPAELNGAQYGVIITDEGELVWSTSGQVVSNLAPQIVDNEPVLVYWDGSGSAPSVGTGYGQVVILDSTYAQLHEICPNFGLVGATNDCQADVHEVRPTKQTIYGPGLTLLSLCNTELIAQIECQTGLCHRSWFSHRTSL
jgi:hypothetical protein